ncbi:hypothetical protein ANN_21310 [Periplaneta americana]|uniref:Uncharacterized protein n=1 Tax=Periplaneta americana TaxID=6978 RepID=A0ABQ8SEZ1_PERAM|nr:hypothetical protein ANN_21310 [Periplaneta americana]
MAGLCEGGNEPPDSLKASKLIDTAVLRGQYGGYAPAVTYYALRPEVYCTSPIWAELRVHRSSTRTDLTTTVPYSQQNKQKRDKQTLNMFICVVFFVHELETDVVPHRKKSSGDRCGERAGHCKWIVASTVVVVCLHVKTANTRRVRTSVVFRFVLHAYAIGILNCVDAALVPLHTTARMRLSSYKKCFRVALIVSNDRNKAQLTLVLLPQNRGRVCSTELVSLVRSRNMFAFFSDERAFNIESYFRTAKILFAENQMDLAANDREPLKLAIGIPLLQSLADFDRIISSLTSVLENVGDKVNEKRANIISKNPGYYQLKEIYIAHKTNGLRYETISVPDVICMHITVGYISCIFGRHETVER